VRRAGTGCEWRDKRRAPFHKRRAPFHKRGPSFHRGTWSAQQKANSFPSTDAPFEEIATDPRGTGSG
jgi:hypothetical protein